MGEQNWENYAIKCHEQQGFGCKASTDHQEDSRRAEVSTKKSWIRGEVFWENF